MKRVAVIIPEGEVTQRVRNAISQTPTLPGECLTPLVLTPW